MMKKKNLVGIVGQAGETKQKWSFNILKWGKKMNFSNCVRRGKSQGGPKDCEGA